MLRRRLRGKQPPPPAPSAEKDLANLFGFLAELLGLNVFRIAAVSRACWGCLSSDQPFWSQVLRQTISLFGVEDKDSASKSIFRRIPRGLQSLDLQLSDVEWGHHSRIDEDTLKILVNKLTSDGIKLKKFSLRLFHSDGDEEDEEDDRVKEELIKSIPSTVEDLSLTTEMDEGQLHALIANLPPKLSSFEVDFKFILEACSSKLFQALPSCLKCLTLGLGEVLDDPSMPYLTRLIKRNEGLDSLCLGMGNCNLDGQNIAALIRSFPSGLRSLQLEMNELDLDHSDIYRAFAEVLGRLKSLQILRLRFEHSKVGPFSELFDAIKVPLSECWLDFGACDLEPPCLGSIAHFLMSQPLENLELNLRANWVSPVAGFIFRSLPGTLRHLALGFFNSNLEGPDMDILSVSLPEQLRSLKLNVNGCGSWSRKHLERFFASLPASLEKLELDAEWCALCRLQQISFPLQLRTLTLHSDAMEGPCCGQRFLKAWAAAIQTLKLRSLHMRFSMCDVSLHSAQHLVVHLPPSLRELSLDLSGLVTESDTELRWKELMGPLISQFGSSVQVPTASNSSDMRMRLNELFAVMSGAGAN